MHSVALCCAAAQWASEDNAHKWVGENGGTMKIKTRMRNDGDALRHARYRQVLRHCKKGFFWYRVITKRFLLVSGDYKKSFFWYGVITKEVLIGVR